MMTDGSLLAIKDQVMKMIQQINGTPEGIRTPGLLIRSQINRGFQVKIWRKLHMLTSKVGFSRGFGGIA